MNRQEFMDKLRAELSNMPRDEREVALEYYEEYFDEAGAENEREVLKELGSPRQVAAQIKSEYAVRQFDEDEKPTVRKGLSALWYVIIGICSAPVAVPLAIALGICAVIGLVVVILCVIVVFAFVISGIAASAVSLYIGVTMFTTAVPVALLLFGAGIAGIGIFAALGALAVIGAKAGTRALVHAFRKAREKKHAGQNRKDISAGESAGEKPAENAADGVKAAGDSANTNTRTDTAAGGVSTSNIMAAGGAEDSETEGGNRYD